MRKDSKRHRTTAIIYDSHAGTFLLSKPWAWGTNANPKTKPKQIIEKHKEQQSGISAYLMFEIKIKILYLKN